MFVCYLLGTLIITAAIGLIHLHYPFMGDQALFTVFARMFDHGAVLYRDVWDVKQPGIFVFYWVAGRLFGFSEAGVHLLELAMWLTFAGVVAWLLRRRLRTQWVAATFPLLLVGAYYATARTNHLTQIEALVGPFIFAAVWLAVSTADTAKPRRLFLSGLAGGVVLVFKLMFGIVVGAIWLVSLFDLVRRRPGIRVVVRRYLAPLAAGVAIPLAISIAYFAANGQLGSLWDTTFVYPRQFIAITPRPMARLVRSIGLIGVLYLPLVLLAAYRLWRSLRGGLDRIDRMLVIWLGTGFITFLLQLWWSYLLLAMLVPIAVLAAEGLDDLVSEIAWSTRRIATGLAVLAIVSSPMALNFSRTAVDWVRSRGAMTTSGVEEYKAAVSPRYAEIDEGVAFLEEVRDGPIYVLGDPLYLYLSNRDQAAAINGWSPEMLTRDLWLELAEQLQSARPDWVYVSTEALEWMDLRSAGIRPMVLSGFVPTRDGESGRWYVPSDTG